MIAAATFIPKQAIFPLGGVRIGAGTGNMGSASWGGGNGEGGTAPLMNTPGINSRATAQMAMKALLKVMPDLPVDHLHNRVAAGDFDTHFSLGNMLKDSRYVLDLAAKAGIDTPAIRTVAERMEELCEAGYASLDYSALAAAYREK